MRQSALAVFKYIGMVAGQQIEEDARSKTDVRPGVLFRQAARRQLGKPQKPVADLLPMLSLEVDVGEIVIADSEIKQPDARRGATLKDNVVGLYVAVDAPLRMAGLKDIEQARRDRHRCLDRHRRLRFAPRSERGSHYELGNDERGDAVVCVSMCIALYEPGDAVDAEAVIRGRFPEEASPALSNILRLDDLEESDLPVGPASRAIYFALAAAI